MIQLPLTAYRLSSFPESTSVWQQQMSHVNMLMFRLVAEHCWLLMPSRVTCLWGLHCQGLVVRAMACSHAVSTVPVNIMPGHLRMVGILEC